MQRVDVLIIGAGIIGLATALKLLQKKPALSLLILEKEAHIARHQTGHNSGVIHSGIYYKPGSLKALNCRKGVESLTKYCQNHSIPFKSIGKLIIATSPEEIPRLDELERRGVANGVPHLKRLNSAEIHAFEPYAKGLAALYSPSTAIVDFSLVAKAYAEDVMQLGGEIALNQKVSKITSKNNHWLVETGDRQVETSCLVNCAGFYADRMGHLSDVSISPKQIIPFRGEYYELKPEKRQLVNGLIYPVPNPEFPFLGVHLSRTIGGSVEAGPNAVLALSREGYTKASINPRDIFNLMTYPGFWLMAAKYWRIGCYELYRSFSKKAFLKSLQRLIPSLEEDDLLPAESGVRSQVVLPDGKLQDDFLIIEKPGVINVLNAPSPAATASLAIGEAIANRVKL